MVSTGGHDRRAFFRELLRGATRAASEVESLRRAADDAVRRAGGSDAGARPGMAPRGRRRRRCASRRSTTCESSAPRSVARPGPRRLRRSRRRASASPPAVDGGSWLGGGPGTPVEWPTWDGEELAFVGRIGLEDLPPTALPVSGALLVFFALDRVPSGLRPEDAGACRVLYVDGETPYRERGGDLPFVPVGRSGELTLPSSPASLAFDPEDTELWDELREQLAAAQGVELEERTIGYRALHRLLGHPDAFAADMDFDAQLVSHGVDLDAEPYARALHADLEACAADWRLLFQLSNDDDLGVDLGTANRLFVWVRRDDLAARRFDRIHAFIR